MDGKKMNPGNELDESIFTHLQSILQSFNEYFNYKNTRLWRKYSKWSIGATVEDPVTNAHSNRSNLSYDITDRSDVMISQPKKKNNNDIPDYLERFK